MLTLRYFGHSAFRIQDEKFSVFIDPLLTQNPLAQVKMADIRRCDFILVSHGHADHFGDTLELARQFKATVVATYELATYCEAQGVKAHGMQPGGGHDFPFGRVKLVPAIHGVGSETPPGSPPMPCNSAVGFLVYWGKNKAVYHAGDTGLFSDMKLVADRRAVDVACLPIGDNYTMGVEDAARAAELIDAQLFVPMHYNTFDVIQADPLAFAYRVEKAGKKCRILKVGEKLEF